MDIKDILIFGLMLEADIFVDGIGTTREDEDLYKQALTKWYRVKDDDAEEVLQKIDNEIMERVKELVKIYRKNVTEYISW